MEPAMHIKTTVLPGKKIEVTSSDLVEGQEVELIIVFPADRARNSILDILGSSPPPGVFTSAEEADRHITQERDSWNH